MLHTVITLVVSLYQQLDLGPATDEPRSRGGAHRRRSTGIMESSSKLANALYDGGLDYEDFEPTNTDALFAGQFLVTCCYDTI